MTLLALSVGRNHLGGLKFAVSPYKLAVLIIVIVATPYSTNNFPLGRVSSVGPLCVQFCYSSILTSGYLCTSSTAAREGIFPVLFLDEFWENVPNAPVVTCDADHD